MRKEVLSRVKPHPPAHSVTAAAHRDEIKGTPRATLTFDLDPDDAIVLDLDDVTDLHRDDAISLDREGAIDVIERLNLR